MHPPQVIQPLRPAARHVPLTSGQAVIFYLTVYITVLLVISSSPPTVAITTISGGKKEGPYDGRR